MDGTLIQAWPSHRSFVPRDGDGPGAGSPSGRNQERDRKGRPRSNETHRSTTDPDARLFRKGNSTAAILAYQGHVLVEHRTGVVVGTVVTAADGCGERAAALAPLDSVPGAHRKTLGADKGYDTREFIAACRPRGVTPHVASQVARKRIEEHLSRAKTVGRIRQAVYRRLGRVEQQFKLTMTASGIVPMARIPCAGPRGVLR